MQNPAAALGGGNKRYNQPTNTTIGTFAITKRNKKCMHRIENTAWITFCRVEASGS